MIYESDLYLLVNLFFPDAEKVAVLDPEHKIRRNYKSGFHLVDDQAKIKQVASWDSIVLVNLTDVPISGYPFDPEAISGAISFRDKPESIEGLKARLFYYVVNEELETIRWVFPGTLAKPFFLDYYDPEADYGNFFRWFTRLCGNLRSMHWIADETFQLFYPDKLFYEEFTEAPVNGFTLFTGRYLSTGKVVLQLVHDKNLVSYLKWPLTEEAESRLIQEYKVLEALNKKAFNNLIVPQGKTGRNNSLILSNILKLRPKGLHKWTKFHFKGLGEYTREFAGERTIEDLLKMEDSLGKLASIKETLRKEHAPKGLSETTMASVYQQLTNLMNQMPLETQIPVSLVHWDFTPENVQIEEGVLKVLDWEHARFDHPALIDVFEFIMYLQEEDYQPSVEQFEKDWQQLQKWQAFQHLQEEFRVDVNLHFRLYLLLRLIPRLAGFLDANFVPYWMNWHLYFWKELLVKVNEQEGWLSEN